MCVCVCVCVCTLCVHVCVCGHFVCFVFILFFCVYVLPHILLFELSDVQSDTMNLESSMVEVSMKDMQSINYACMSSSYVCDT